MRNVWINVWIMYELIRENQGDNTNRQQSNLYNRVIYSPDVRKFCAEE